MSQVSEMKRLQPLHIKLPPTSSATRTVTPIGPEMQRESLQVYLWAPVVTDLLKAARRRPRVFQTALLVGSVCAGPAERFLEVRGYIDLERHDDFQDFIRTLEESWTILNNRIARQDEPFVLAGWALLASQEKPLGKSLQMTHRSFFNLPYQNLLTVDPKKEELVLYGYDETGYLAPIGYKVVVDHE